MPTVDNWLEKMLYFVAMAKLTVLVREKLILTFLKTGNPSLTFCMKKVKVRGMKRERCQVCIYKQGNFVIKTILVLQKIGSLSPFLSFWFWNFKKILMYVSNF